MEDFSLYVLDITMNSVRAGADEIGVSIAEEGDTLTLTVEDNGCGMTAEQLSHLSDPFFTTRKTRGVGLGVPFLKMLAEQTGGSLTVVSTPAPDADHGTMLTATFGRHHIDFVPLGDLVGTVVTLVQGSPAVNFTYTHRTERGTVSFSSAEVRAVLGEEISLGEPEILQWIEGDLREQYTALS
ncbi:MAG: ATP-binding protein [Clostridia bacterium]|nr:ATP-binding protein [Clostridia bacterium]